MNQSNMSTFNMDEMKECLQELEKPKQEDKVSDRRLPDEISTMDEQTISKYEQLYKDEQMKCSNLEKKKQYLSAKVKVHESSLNKGEKDEILLLIDLFHYNQTKQYDKLVDIFGDDASDGIHILSMDTNNELVTDIDTFSKAKGTYKSDCVIKMIKTGYIYYASIKSKNCANPAILNHTPRTAKVFRPDGILHEYISNLDIVIQEYIDKRKRNIIGEDTSINQLESFKIPAIRLGFMNVLSYFVFEGSGKGDSIYKANSVLYYEMGQIIFTKCRNSEEKREYIENIYNNVVISLRDKGMPKNNDDYCKPWVFDDIKSDGSMKHKGSLHIRIK